MRRTAFITALINPSTSLPSSPSRRSGSGASPCRDETPPSATLGGRLVRVRALSRSSRSARTMRCSVRLQISRRYAAARLAGRRRASASGRPRSASLSRRRCRKYGFNEVVESCAILASVARVQWSRSPQSPQAARCPSGLDMRSIISNNVCQSGVERRQSRRRRSLGPSCPAGGADAALAFTPLRTYTP
ncbi:Uncharacterized protein DAT39_012297 [Clarias magur]|uniref:Uncharacterized protein n=1 Tax=Clarias magur TaxID=1594786 RepID=A0A8J4XDD5_CLAMG|nr:Uncharacterized protein DAT39_012297 [Clarias magur]